MKRNLFRLPITTGKSYDDSSTDAAFVIPIFVDNVRPITKRERERDFTYVKASLANMRSLTANTDVMDRKIPVYFLLEDILYAEWKDLYYALGIKESRVLSFTACEGPVKDRRVSKKFYGLNHPALSDYKQVFVLDADFFFANSDSYYWLEIASIESEKPGFLHYYKNDLPGSEFKGMSGWFNKWMHGEEPDKNFEETQNQLVRHFPNFAIDPSCLYHCVLGGLIRIPQSMALDLVDFCLELDPMVGDDELILSIYTTHNDPDFRLYESIIDSHNNLNTAYGTESMMKNRGNGTYMLHMCSYEEIGQSWESTYHYDIGLRIEY